MKNTGDNQPVAGDEKPRSLQAGNERKAGLPGIGGGSEPAFLRHRASRRPPGGEGIGKGHLDLGQTIFVGLDIWLPENGFPEVGANLNGRFGPRFR